MKTTLKIIAVILILTFVGIQFIRPERSNPRTNSAEVLSASASVPDEISKIIERSCNDCHSNETRWPWYSQIAPFSWSVAEHVDHGREELNFSAWGTYSVSKKERKLEEICDEVEHGGMPHYQYLWIHSEAALTESQVASICDWTRSASSELEERVDRDTQ